MSEEIRKITMKDTKIQAWSLDRLTPAENNHKKHSEESTQRLAKSLASVGQIQPVIVDKNGEIIAGHGRWMAAQHLGWEKIKVIQVPVSRAVAIEARIADNLMSNQEIDNNKLSAEIEELRLIVDSDDMDLGSMIMDDDLGKLLSMSVSDDYNLDQASLTNDILGASKSMTEETDDLLTEIEATELPLRKVFGFSSVTPSQARILKDFMAEVMAEGGEEDPSKALVKWVEGVMA
jgi:hypothetical protein